MPPRIARRLVWVWGRRTAGPWRRWGERRRGRRRRKGGQGRRESRRVWPWWKEAKIWVEWSVVLCCMDEDELEGLVRKCLIFFFYQIQINQ